MTPNAVVAIDGHTTAAAVPEAAAAAAAAVDAAWRVDGAAASRRRGCRNQDAATAALTAILTAADASVYLPTLVHIAATGAVGAAQSDVSNVRTGAPPTTPAVGHSAPHLGSGRREGGRLVAERNARRLCRSADCRRHLVRGCGLPVARLLWRHARRRRHALVANSDVTGQRSAEGGSAAVAPTAAAVGGSGRRCSGRHCRLAFTAAAATARARLEAWRRHRWLFVLPVWASAGCSLSATSGSAGASGARAPLSETSDPCRICHNTHP